MASIEEEAQKKLAEILKRAQLNASVNAEATPTVSEPLVKPVELTDDSFKKCFGFKPTINTGATVFEKDSWDKNTQARIPEIDTDYVLEPEATSVITYALESNQFVNIVGPTGSGKSTLVEQICARTNRPFIRINGRGDMESMSLLGQLVVENGATVWKDGALTEAVKMGATVLFDEYTVVPPEINMSLQWLREHNGKLLLSDKPGDIHDKMVIPHKDFRLICADNTRGLGDNNDKFAGANLQNTAALNRFDITVVHDYMSMAKEKKIISNKFDLPDQTVTMMVKMASLIRKGYDKGDISITLSPRNLLSWAKKATDWGDLHKAFAFTYLNLLPSTAEKGAVQGYYKTVFDVTLS